MQPPRWKVIVEIGLTVIRLHCKLNAVASSAAPCCSNSMFSCLIKCMFRQFDPDGDNVCSCTHSPSGPESLEAPVPANMFVQVGSTGSPCARSCRSTFRGPSRRKSSSPVLPSSYLHPTQVLLNVFHHLPQTRRSSGPLELFELLVPAGVA